jgi:hypothetical protein
MLRSLCASLMILLAAPACAGSPLVSGFHGGGFHRGGFPAVHRRRRAHNFFFGGYLCGYNCGLGFGSEGYDYGDSDGNGYNNTDGYGYGYGYGYGNGNGNGYRGGVGNASSSNGSAGGYVPGPVGADIPPLIIPTNCWVRRPAYDPSGAYFGQVLVNLCRASERVTVTGLKARVKTPDPGSGVPKDHDDNTTSPRHP